MMPSPQARARIYDDQGSMLPLTIFFSFFCLVLVLLVASATTLYLERKRLFTLADGAALVGAEAFELRDVEVTSSGPRVALRSADVAVAVQRYLESTETASFESLQLESAGTVDGRSASVQLSSYWRPPVLSLLVPEGIRLEVTAVARSVFH